MRLALQSEISGQVEQLQSLAPDVEAFVLRSTDDPRERIATNALLGTAVGGPHLPALIQRPANGGRRGYVCGLLVMGICDD